MATSRRLEDSESRLSGLNICYRSSTTYVLDEVVEGVYAARGPFEAVLFQHKSAGHDETFVRPAVTGAFRVAVVTRPYPTHTHTHVHIWSEYRMYEFIFRRTN